MNQNRKGNYYSNGKGNARANSYSRSRSRSNSKSPRYGGKVMQDKSVSDKRYVSRDDRNRSRDGAGKGEKFVWSKKLEEQKKKEVDPRAREQEERNKQMEMQREMEKVQNRKEFREKREMASGQQKGEAKKMSEEEAYKVWLEQEEKFHVEQAKLRL